MLKRMWNSWCVLIALLMVITLITACGGGGGSNPAGNSGSNSGNPAPGTIASITTNIFTDDTYDSSELSEDPATGQTIVRTKLTILFRPTAIEDEVNGLLSRINATVTASIAGSRSVSIRIPDPGSVAALNAIITDIKSETFVEAVMKALQIQPSELPDNVSATNSDDWMIIDNQLAIGGPAAWNAKKAIVIAPNVIIADVWGHGVSPLESFLDATVSGAVLDGAENASNHGYHVAGILNGSFGGGSSTAALVTGIYPGHANLHLIDLSRPLTSYETFVSMIMLADSIGGTVITNTSLAFACDDTTTTGSCIETADIMEGAIIWIDLVRAAGMESKMFHATAAGNRGNPRFDARDAETVSESAAAALMTDIATIDGVQIPPLTNTVVVENVYGSGHPRKVECLSLNSFIGGTISAIGADVTSLANIGIISLSGTSMATPQVAGLAAYLLAIDPTLSPQKIKEILLNTAQAVPTAGGVNCSDATAAPAIDAYAAVLALDESSALTGSPINAPVRLAILDVSSDGTTIDDAGNGQFDEFDLMFFVQEFDIGTQEKSNDTANVKYSRVDLNGDGYDGGTNSYRKKFNLDIDYPPTFSTVKQIIEGQEVEFDENSLTDDDILCYYAYSSLYTGDTTIRANLLANRCQAPSTVAIYYFHNNEVFFPPPDIGCGNVNADLFEQRENFSTRPDYFATILPERPESHFWQPGETHVDQRLLDTTTVRRAFDPAGAFNNCDKQQSYYAASENDTDLELVTDNMVSVDITITSTSECWVWSASNAEWNCSSSTTYSQWNAEYDFKISAATNLNLVLDFVCSGANLTDPANTIPSQFSALSFFAMRRNPTGEEIPTNRDLSKRVFGQNLNCDQDSPTVSVQQLFEFDAPVNPGDVDRIIVSVSGSAGAFGNLGNIYQLIDPAYQPVPVLGRQTNITTMQGTVKLIPAN